MLSKNEYLEAIKVIENAIQKSISIFESAQGFGINHSQIVHLLAKIDVAYTMGSLSKEEWDYYSNLITKLESNSEEDEPTYNSNEEEVTEIVQSIMELSQHTKNDKSKNW